MADDAERTTTGAEAADLSRRNFLRGAGGVAAGGVLAPALLGAGASAGASGADPSGASPTGRAAIPPVVSQRAEAGLSGEIEIELALNGARRKVVVEPRTTLLDALRMRVEPPLTGTKSVCDRGNCGACTVLVDGEPRYACLQLACDLQGRAITTIEGLGQPEALSVLQEEFVTHDGTMCGFCTPGFVVAIHACLARDPRASEAQIRDACAGNACRCGTHPQVFAAALAAGRRLAAENRAEKK